ncbi:MAG: hypothetical protein AVDCRST_MAG53-1924, partial [uncultured Solirubrobacteraceae bacterium]
CAGSSTALRRQPDQESIWSVSWHFSGAGTSRVIRLGLTSGAH